jgi:hypothetical protein
MKAGKIFVLAILTGICWPYATVNSDSAKLSEKQNLLIFKELPSITVVVNKFPVEAEQQGLTRQQLKTAVESRLGQSDIAVTEQGAKPMTRNTPKLRIDIDVIVIEEKASGAIRINVACNDRVSLARKPGLFLECNIWEKEKFELVELENLKSFIENKVTILVDDFIIEYQAANPQKKKQETSDDTKTITGKICRGGPEGPAYGIRGDDGEYYDPRNLPIEFRKYGLRVKVKFVQIRGLYGFHMWGTLIDIVEIE